MRTGTTRKEQGRTERLVLHVAFELDDFHWTLTMGTGMRREPRQRQIRPRDRSAILGEIQETKRRFGLGAEVRIVTCYEAGREGFWLHRWLESEGIENLVVDSASIEVDRRKRRVKADRLDGKKLLRMLIRYESGERGVWSVVRIPSVEAEDARHLHRGLDRVKRDRVRVTNRIHGLLATQGIRVKNLRNFSEQLPLIRLWDGSALPPGLHARLGRAWEQRLWLTEQIRILEAEQRTLLRTSDARPHEQVRQLMLLHGIGHRSAWIFVMEFFSWRQFRNRSEVGALAGLTPTAYQSGTTDRDQGISKAGNAHVRGTIVQIAWAWLRHQPNSELSRWYDERFGSGSGRVKKIGIVALSRRLLIELWRYLETGALPEGATLKA